MKIIFTSLVLLSPAASAVESYRTASITQAVNEVQIYPGEKAAHNATVGEKIALPSSVQTGRRSRTELTFNDSSITRLGQNSVFSFREGGRNVELKQGSILLQVPKNAGGATIRTATVTAAITGTTVMFEYSPGKWLKLLTLEGCQKLYINGSNQYVSVPAGKMIIMDPNSKTIPAPVTIDLLKLVNSSPLAGEGTFGRLPKKSWDAIWDTIKEQQKLKNQGILLPTDYVISGPGFHNSKGINGSAGTIRTAPQIKPVPPKDPKPPRPPGKPPRPPGLNPPPPPSNPPAPPGLNPPTPPGPPPVPPGVNPPTSPPNPPGLNPPGLNPPTPPRRPARPPWLKRPNPPPPPLAPPGVNPPPPPFQPPPLNPPVPPGSPPTPPPLDPPRPPMMPPGPLIISPPLPPGQPPRPPTLLPPTPPPSPPAPGPNGTP